MMVAVSIRTELGVGARQMLLKPQKTTPIECCKPNLDSVTMHYTLPIRIRITRLMQTNLLRLLKSWAHRDSCLIQIPIDSYPLSCKAISSYWRVSVCRFQTLAGELESIDSVARSILTLISVGPNRDRSLLQNSLNTSTRFVF